MVASMGLLWETKSSLNISKWRIGDTNSSTKNIGQAGRRRGGEGGAGWSDRVLKTRTHHRGEVETNIKLYRYANIQTHIYTNPNILLTNSNIGNINNTSSVKKVKRRTGIKTRDSLVASMGLLWETESSVNISKWHIGDTQSSTKKMVRRVL